MQFFLNEEHVCVCGEPEPISTKLWYVLNINSSNDLGARANTLPLVPARACMFECMSMCVCACARLLRCE